jgi:hypothetical protein
MKHIDSKNFLPKLALTVSFATLLAACGGGGGGGGGSSSPGPQQQQEPIDETNYTYMAPFSTINQPVAGIITGSTTLHRLESKFYADVRFNGLHPNLIKPQYVHTGSRCPTMADDTNGDGFIDAVEGEAVYGQVLIPLDADLSSQDRGSSYFTMSNPWGFYEYHQVTSYDRFMRDLTESDSDPDDNFVKLSDEKSLSLASRVVVVYGVPKETVLPTTVARRGRLANFQTLPVACGVFSQVITVPGTVDTDEGIPVEPGTTIGGSNGEEDGDGTVVVLGNESIPSMTSGTGSGTNETDSNSTTSGGGHIEEDGTTPPPTTVEPAPTEPTPTEPTPTEPTPTEPTPPETTTGGSTGGVEVDPSSSTSGGVFGILE